MREFDGRYANGQVLLAPAETNPPGIAVVLGWHERNKRPCNLLLEAGLCAVVGNLYNTHDGLTRFIRSLLANPWLHTIVLLDAKFNPSQSARTLRRLFQDGVVEGRNHNQQPRWQIVEGDEVLGSICPNIPEAAINRLRERCRLVVVKTVNDLPSTLEKIGRTGISATDDEPQHFFEEPPAELDYWPGSPTGHVVVGPTVADVWPRLIEQIIRRGHRVPNPHFNEPTCELVGMQSVITDDDPVDPHLPVWLGITKEELEAYAAGLLNPVRPDGVAYTYGERISGGLGGVIARLTADRFDRGGVISVWQDTDCTAASPPCLISLWFRMVPSENSGLTLHMAVALRSHDIFGAYPLNLLGLRRLQHYVAEQLGNSLSAEVGVGHTCCTSNSAHIYGTCLADAKLIAERHARQPAPGTDPNGNYRLEGRNNNIVLVQLDPVDNLELRRFEGSADQLIHLVVKLELTSQPGHLAWLIEEICKLR